MNPIRILTSIFAFLAPVASFAFVATDSITKTPKTIYYDERAVDKGFINSTPVDSTLNIIHQYRNRYNLGNIGLANTLFCFPTVSPILGFNFANNNFNDYTYQAHQLKYYDTHTPYTQLFFTVGSKKELISKFIHSQNVNKNLNVTANFQRIRSDGFYKRQNTNHTNLALSGNYKSSNKRYFLISNLIFNSLKNGENGGLANDSTFEKSPLQDRRLLDINLTAADRRYRSRSVYLKQYINLGSKLTPTDSINRALVTPTSVVSHSVLLQDESFIYKDLDPLVGFYNNTFNDTIRTLDSSYISKLENKIEWRLLKNKRDGTSRNIGFLAGAKHQLIKHTQFTAIDSVINSQALQSSNHKLYGLTVENIIANVDVYNFDGNKFNYALMGEYVISGFNAGDNSWKADLKYTIDSSQTIGFTASATNRKPDNIYLNYNSNHFKWSNRFDNVSYMNVTLFYKFTKYDFECGLSTLQYKNYVYFGVLNAAQDKSTIQSFSAYLIKTFHFRNFGFSNKIIYQHIADSLTIKLPKWVTEHSVYYENTIFKKALQFRLGIDVFYNSAYFANAWNPALGQFYLQSKKEIGNYIYGDVFLSMKVSKARMFVKYEHLNAGLTNNFTYYYAPHYPLADGAVKVGVVWNFFD